MIMPRKLKDNQPFDQQKYIQEWTKQNMKQIKAQYKAAFVNDFKQACKALGLTQSEVIRKAMQETIDKAKESR